MNEEATVCLHCTRDVPNAAMLSSSRASTDFEDLPRGAMKLGGYTLGLTLIIGSTADYFSIPCPDWLIVLIFVFSFVLSAVLYRKLPPR